jgi:hypothetical protein
MRRRAIVPVGIPEALRSEPPRSIPGELDRFRAPTSEENVSDAVQPSEFQLQLSWKLAASLGKFGA